VESKEGSRLVSTRFAPSPTGLLHIGGARTALFNYLYAKRNSGRFLLRFEDTDRERSSALFEEAILNDLKWLGIEPDEKASRQTERAARYREVLECLLAKGFAYPCFCPHDDDSSPRRPQADRCRFIPRDDRLRRIEAKEPFCMRFAAPQGDVSVTFSDRLRGEMTVKGSSIGDFVLSRSDGSPTYLFAVVVDDHDFNVTHVIRGEEHLPNTPKQELIYRALGWEAPEWIHIPMVLDSERHKLSKRSGAISVASYREDGWSAEALISYMATLSWAGAPADRLSDAAILAGGFDIGDVSLDSPTHDTERMSHFGKMAMRKIEPDSLLREYRSLFPQPENHGKDLDSDRAALIGELLPACSCKKELEMTIRETFKFNAPREAEPADTAWMPELRKKLALLAPEAWGAGNLKNILKGFQKERELKGKILYHALRIRLTGAGHGVPIALLMGCLGRENALERFDTAGERQEVKEEDIK
jgi:glutamyl-tRNA synthetase